MTREQLLQWANELKQHLLMLQQQSQMMQGASGGGTIQQGGMPTSMGNPQASNLQQLAAQMQQNAGIQSNANFTPGAQQQWQSPLQFLAGRSMFGIGNFGGGSQ